MFQGNAIVGQSGGPTCVINSSLCGVVQGCFELGQKNADSKRRNNGKNAQKPNRQLHVGRRAG